MSWPGTSASLGHAQMWQWLGLVVLALSSVMVVSADQGEALKFLFVGNSYTNGMLNCASDISNMFEDLVPVWTDVEDKKVTSGAATFVDQIDDLDKWSGPYHSVVLQDQPQVPGLGYNTGFYQDSLSALQILYEEVLDVDAIPILFQTWGRLYGDSVLPSYYPDFVTMNNKLKQGYATYAIETSTQEQQVFVAPVGDVFGRIWDDIADTASSFGEQWNWDPTMDGSPLEMLYKGDGSHPDGPYGCFVIQLTIVTSITGRDPHGYWYGESNGWADGMDSDLVNYYISVIRDIVYQDCWWSWEYDWGQGPAYAWVYYWDEVEADVSIGSMEETPAVLLSTGQVEEHSIVSVASGSGMTGRLRIEGTSTQLVASLMTVGVQNGHGIVEQHSGEVLLDFLFVGDNTGGEAEYYLYGGNLSVQQKLSGNSNSIIHLLGGRLELGTEMSATVQFDAGEVALCKPITLTQDLTMGPGVTLTFVISKHNIPSGYMTGAVSLPPGYSIVVDGNIAFSFEPGVVIPGGEEIILISGSFSMPNLSWEPSAISLAPELQLDVNENIVKLTCTCQLGCQAVSDSDVVCLSMYPAPPSPADVYFGIGIILVSDKILLPLTITNLAPISAISIGFAGTSEVFPEALSGGIAENMTTLMGSSSALMFLNPSAYPPVPPGVGNIFSFLVFDITAAGKTFCLEPGSTVVTSPQDTPISFLFKDTCVTLDIVCPGMGTGDINMDALVNILDVVQAVEITLALDTPWEPELTECEFATIDTTSDGVINLFDLLFLVDVVVST